MERRLAAILAADVVGYSRLVREDEAGTLATLKAHLQELIEPKVAERKGRIVKLMGDGVLAEFPSAVEAVLCAVEIQHLIGARNADVPMEEQITFRIGINIGDIVVEDDDIYGDGVNVAARLEGLAEPGGISVARNVFDQVKDKLDLTIEHLGEREVKNIAEPVTVYRVVLDDKAAALVTPVVQEATKPAGRPWVVPAAVVVLVLAAGGAFWWQPWAPDVEPASVERMAFPLPDKPSIAVLPFANMSDDPSQGFFADGMTDDLITDLSKVSGLFVIARNSTFVYKGRAVQIRRVAEELGVRYVLEGSVRRAGDQVRINAQLIDATTGGHLWAERYDGDLASVFALQDRVTRKIVEALKVSLTDGEQEQIERSRTANVAAHDAFLKGWERYQRFTPEDMAAAVPYFEQAIELDPEYGRAYAAIGLVYFRGCQWKWHEPLGVGYVKAFDISSNYLKKARERPNSLAHVLASQIHLYDREHEDAFVEAERAVALDPNDPEAHIAMGWALITTGRPDEGVAFVKRAMRINPGYPSHYLLALGTADFAMGRFDEAAAVYKQALERNPGDIAPLAPLAAAYARSDRREEAWAAFETWKVKQEKKGEQAYPGSYKFLFKWPRGRVEVTDLLTDGLSIAALPLDVTVPDLMVTLKEGEFSGRLFAARTLGRFGPLAAEAVPALIEALVDEKVVMRKQAILALGKIGPGARAAIPALTALQNQNRIGWHARKSLKKITGK